MNWWSMTLLISASQGVIGSTDAECHCNTTSACDVFPSTPCSATSGPDRCQKGWFGPYCQKENVALGRPTNQSSTYRERSSKTNHRYYNFTSEHGVDGISTTQFYKEPLTCSHTKSVNNRISYWTVQLNTSNSDRIQHMRLYLRNELRWRHNGIEILVNEQLCAKWDRYKHPSDVASVTCDPPLLGNIVKIQIPRNNTFVTLCEVQIFVCADGWFGHDCDKQCQCFSNTEICDKITGKCANGCAPGFTGEDCQIVCPDGYYGINCTSQCGNCLNDDDICDKETGACPSGCSVGWTSDTCTQPCAHGFYGINCAYECGGCLQDCEKTSGTCLGGCKPGWLNDTCQQPCDEGMYGTNCTLQCGHCRNRICNNTDGTCQDGCVGHFSAPLCQECLHTHYGATCNETCETCAGTDSCDPGTGECPYGCVLGFDQADVGCKNDALTHSPGFDVSITAGGAAVSALAVIVVVVVAAVVICRRRKITEDKIEEEKADGSSLQPQYEMITMVNNSVNGELSEENSVDCEPYRTVPAAPLYGEPARTPSAALLDGEPARTPSAALLNSEPARTPSAALLNGEPARTPSAALLGGEPTTATPEPVLDDEDEDAMFSLEPEEDVEATTTYYNWIPPHMTLDKLPQCIEKKKKKSSFQAEFQAIPYGARRPHEVGKKPENKQKNRFVALYSYDHSRVVLTEGGDYINANYISGHDDTTMYIATQGPTPATIADFWQMVWQEKVMEIVMLTNLREKKKKKCEQYWPDEHTSCCYGSFSITNKKTIVRSDYRASTFLVTKSTEERRVRHFHFTSWPDHGVPSAPTLVNFWRLVKQAHTGGRPLVVHCSAGVGRTGTFIALDHLMDEAVSVNVFLCVGKMREARMNMVQTVSQYEFVHDVVLEAIRSRGTAYTLTEFEKEFGQEATFTETQETKLRKEFSLLQDSTSRLPEKIISTSLLPENAGNKTKLHQSTPVHQRNDSTNAVVLSSFQRPNNLIVTQTPLPGMLVDFWRFVYEHDCHIVICLDDSKEMERVYPKENQTFVKGPFTIVHVREVSDREMYTQRMFTVVYKGCERSVVVFSLKCLGMMSRPASLLELVNSVHMVITSADHKVLVHCRDGASVSGVFCGVLNIISRLRLDSDVDVFLTIRELQRVRPQFMQSFEDYQLCYKMVKEYSRAASVYANM